MRVEKLFLTEDTNVTLTCYIQEQSNELTNARIRPTILILPGGGYSFCSDREAEPIALAYMAEGYQAFVLRYTVGKGAVFPRPLEDAEKALETILERAGEWGVDTDKIAVIGFSAGGHLAAALGTMGRIRPKALVLGYPCILESMGKILETRPPGLDDKVDSSTPPSFIFTTQADELVPVANSLAFACALERNNVPFEMHIFQEGAHGLSLSKPLTSNGFKTMVNPTVAQWFKMSIDWLAGIFGDFDSSQDPVVKNVLWEFERYGIDVALECMWKNAECKKILLSYVPVLQDESIAKSIMKVSLRIIANYTNDLLPESTLAEIDEKLQEVKVEK